MTSFNDRYLYYPNFVDEEVEDQESTILPKVTQPVRGRGRFPLR